MLTSEPVLYVSSNRNGSLDPNIPNTSESFPGCKSRELESVALTRKISWFGSVVTRWLSGGCERKVEPVLEPVLEPVPLGSLCQSGVQQRVQNLSERF